MGLRICLVTPFAWSQPHDVNEHVAGVADALRERGHSVTVLAPSNRAADLSAGRRALRDGAEAPLIALGPAVPISRRSRIGLPVGVQANLATALARGGFDVVHGFEPGLPSLSYLALRDAQGLTVASFFSAERLGYPPGRAQRERLLGRIDALVAASTDAAHAADQRFPGDLPDSPDTDEGSNMWAIAPSRTTTRHAMLLINPHVGFFGGGQRYEAHLHSEEGWDAVGGLFPGAPLILHGHHRNLGCNRRMYIVVRAAANSTGKEDCNNREQKTHSCTA